MHYNNVLIKWIIVKPLREDNQFLGNFIINLFINLSVKMHLIIISPKTLREINLITQLKLVNLKQSKLNKM